MFRKIPLVAAFFIFGCSLQQKNDKISTQQIIQSSDALLQKSMSVYDRQFNPRSYNMIEGVDYVKPKDWTSGFYPGCLWLMYEFTKDTNYLKNARHFTELLESEKTNGTTHDLGFKMFCSYGNGYRINGNQEYKEILLQSARTLITRYNIKVGCIRSWDHNSDKWQFPVIIDNMMNLELLFWAFKETDDSTYYNIAVSHANNTLKNHFRPDYSSCHVVDYDTITGKPIKWNTHQGYSDSSAWSRGQAWGLYGFTMVYRETKDEKFLEQAKKIASYIFNHPNMPKDLIPYWDFDDPKIPDSPKDASAAAVIASALYELSTFSQQPLSETYKTWADKIISELASPNYFHSKSDQHNFLLNHSTGNKPDDSEVDCPIIYADYYFLEALDRKNKLAEKINAN